MCVIIIVVVVVIVIVVLVLVLLFVVIKKPSVFPFSTFFLKVSSFNELEQPGFKVTFSFLKLKTRGKDSDFTAQNHVSSTGLPSNDPGVIDFCW